MTSCESVVADICPSFLLLALLLSRFFFDNRALYRNLSFVAYAISSMSLFKLSFTHIHSPSVVVSIFRNNLHGVFAFFSSSSSSSSSNGSRLNTPLAPVMNTTRITTGSFFLVLSMAYAFATSSAILSPLKIDRPCAASSTTSPWSRRSEGVDVDDADEEHCSSQYSLTPTLPLSISTSPFSLNRHASPTCLRRTVISLSFSNLSVTIAFNFWTLARVFAHPSSNAFDFIFIIVFLSFSPSPHSLASM